ncbi:MAG: PIN domain-containing protein [Deltaproteobacteria bacterium]|nr:PIN domain-containing protein [Deltaproteobacteria bacterium]
MVPVFVDTGGWIAMAVVRDQYHKQAASFYQELSKHKAPLLSSNYVLTETYTCIRYNDGHGKAIRFHSLIKQAVRAGRLHIEWVTPGIHQEAWTIFQDYEDQVFSLVDCTSFVIAKHAGVKEAFGCDEHFNTMGLILMP